MFPSIALTMTALLLIGGLAGAEGKAPLSWKGRKLDASTPPKDLGEAPRRAIAVWLPWASKAGYRMDLDAEGRVLVLTPDESSRAPKLLELAARGVSWFDGLLPKPSARTGESGGTSLEPSSGSSDEIPEDPEGPPPGAEKGPPAKAKAGTGIGSQEGSPWGSGSVEPDSQTATLIALADERDQASVLEFLASAHPDLRGWASQAAADLGFVVELPLAAAFVESASGQEEWNRDHEILNRLARLLTLRRFGQLPNWLVHAIAWEAEMTFDGSIWVYPNRSEFVYTTEHGAWPSELANEFKDRAKSPLEIEELTRWASRTWDGTAARHAYGFFHCLASTKKDSLSPMLEDLRRYRDANNRKPSGDGTWTREPGWEPPAAAQLAILRAHCGEKVLEEASAWLAKPTAPSARAESREKSK